MKDSDDEFDDDDNFLDSVPKTGMTKTAKISAAQQDEELRKMMEDEASEDGECREVINLTYRHCYGGRTAGEGVAE